MNIELDREEDGRWIAEVIDLPGAMAYGATREEAVARVKALALRILADRVEHGIAVPEITQVFALLTRPEKKQDRQNKTVRSVLPVF